MKPTHRRHRVVAALSLALLAAGLAKAAEPLEAPCFCTVPSQDPSALWVLPAVRQAGAVRYRTGGIGLVEAAAMRADRGHYPLSLEFLVQDRTRYQYTSRVTVEIVDAHGDKWLGVTSDGPFVLADLPAGRYHVTAISEDGRLRSRDVVIGAGSHQELRFVWPAR